MSSRGNGRKSEDEGNGSKGTILYNPPIQQGLLSRQSSSLAFNACITLTVTRGAKEAGMDCGHERRWWFF